MTAQADARRCEFIKKSQQNIALYQDQDLQALRFIPTSDDELRNYLKYTFWSNFFDGF
jgi:hypothetical protein